MEDFKHAFKNLLLGLEALALIIGIPAAAMFVLDLEDRQSGLKAQAWGILAIRVPGNSGKVDAIEYLNDECIGIMCYPDKAKSDLARLDLSSASHGGQVSLRNIKLDSSLINISDFEGADMNSAKLTNTYAPGANFKNVWFYNSEIVDSNFTNTCLKNVGFQGSVIKNTDFMGSILEGADFTDTELSNLNFTGSDMSGVVFDGDTSTLEFDNVPKSWSREYFPRAWYLEGKEPTGIDLSRLEQRTEPPFWVKERSKCF